MEIDGIKPAPHIYLTVESPYFGFLLKRMVLHRGREAEDGTAVEAPGVEDASVAKPTVLFFFA